MERRITRPDKGEVESKNFFGYVLVFEKSGRVYNPDRKIENDCVGEGGRGEGGGGKETQRLAKFRANASRPMIKIIRSTGKRTAPDTGELTNAFTSSRSNRSTRSFFLE